MPTLFFIMLSKLMFTLIDFLIDALIDFPTFTLIFTVIL